MAHEVKVVFECHNCGLVGRTETINMKVLHRSANNQSNADAMSRLSVDKLARDRYVAGAGGDHLF